MKTKLDVLPDWHLITNWATFQRLWRPDHFLARATLNCLELFIVQLKLIKVFVMRQLLLLTLKQDSNFLSHWLLFLATLV